MASKFYYGVHGLEAVFGEERQEERLGRNEEKRLGFKRESEQRLPRGSQNKKETNNLEHAHPAWLKGVWGERQTDRRRKGERENMALAQRKNPTPGSSPAWWNSDT